MSRPCRCRLCALHVCPCADFKRDVTGLEAVVQTWNTAPLIDVTAVPANASCLSLGADGQLVQAGGAAVAGWQSISTLTWPGAASSNCACPQLASDSFGNAQGSSSSACNSNQTSGTFHGAVTACGGITDQHQASHPHLVCACSCCVEHLVMFFGCYLQPHACTTPCLQPGVNLSPHFHQLRCQGHSGGLSCAVALTAPLPHLLGVMTGLFRIPGADARVECRCVVPPLGGKRPPGMTTGLCALTPTSHAPCGSCMLAHRWLCSCRWA